MNPERIKAWAPVAFLLIFSSIISAVIGLTEGYEKFISWIYPEGQKKSSIEQAQLTYPVVSGYINGNGNKEGDIFSDLLNHRDGMVYISGAIDVSRGVGENGKYMEFCDPYQQEDIGEETYIKIKTGGSAKFTGPKFDDYDIVCGENSLEIYLKSRLSSTVSAGVDIENFSGLFIVSISYQGLSQRISLNEISIPPHDEIALRNKAMEDWEEIIKYAGDRY